MKHSDKSSTILMFIVFFLTFIVLWNIADVVSRIENQKQGNTPYEHTITFNILYEKPAELIENGYQEEAKQYIEECVKDLFAQIDHVSKCNISIANYFLPILSKQDSVLCEVVLKENIELPYEIQETINPSGSLLIGETLKQYILLQEGTEYLCLDKENYSVNAVLKNYGMNRQDERVVMLYQSFNESDKERFYERFVDYNFNIYTIGITITIAGNREADVMGTYQEFEEYADTLEDASIRVVPARNRVGELNYWYQYYRSIFVGISILFAVLNGVVVSNLWFHRRRREYIIRLTFGYTRKRICLLIWGELGKISILSLLCSTIFWIISLTIKRSVISWYMIMLQCAVMLVGAFLVLFITTIQPLREVMSLDPAAGLRKYRG